MTTDSTQFVKPAEAVKIIRRTRGVQCCLHLRVNAYDENGNCSFAEQIGTWLDISRSQALAAVQRLAKDPYGCNKFIRIHISNNVLWIG